MIETLNNNCIVVGDWGYYTDNWISILCDTHKNLSWQNLFQSNKGNNGESNNISRCIDNSNHVIRCSWLRTKEPVGGYGYKTDSIQTHPLSLIRYSDIGFYERLDFDQEHSEITRNKYKHYKVRSSRIKSSEVWFSVGDLYRHKNLRRNIDENKMLSFIKEIKLSIDTLQKVYSTNYRFLSFDDYMELSHKLRDKHLTFDEIMDISSQSNWGTHLTRNVGSVRNVKECSNIIKSQRDCMYINRGLQAMYIMLKDKRFNHHKKFFIGHLGISETFSHGKNHYNQFAEYLLLTEWINKGLINYLPEHVNDMNLKLQVRINSKGLPIS